MQLEKRILVVDIARNGEEALAKIPDSRYALIVLDLMMPRMSGYQFLDHLAALPAGSVQPMMLRTDCRPRAKAVQYTDRIGTMHKPFDIELLVDTLHTCLAIEVEQTQPDTCASTDRLTRPEEAN